MTYARWSSWSVLVAVAVAAACGSSGGSGGKTFTPVGSDASVPPAQGDASLPNLGVEAGPTGPVTDFPAPIVDGNTPSNAPSLFGGPTQGAPTGGPCLYEPEVTALFPQNWLRPRFRWTPAAGQNIFELRLHVANQTQDLLVYTTGSGWTMPAPLWNALRNDSAGQAMTVTVRGGALPAAQIGDAGAAGPLTNESTGTTGPLGIAPVQATGSIVYWTTSASSALKGFAVGDESVVTVLTPPQVTENTFSCIGCHTSTPGGEYAAFSGQGPSGWPNGLALIDQDAGTVGAPPTFLGAGGAAALATFNLGIEAFSPAHWATGDRREIVSHDTGAPPATLEWIDIEATAVATASGPIARTGDTASAGAPAWSHDGNTIAYVSTNHTCDGRLGRCDAQFNDPTDPGATADVFTVPYAAGAGGAATALKGASDPAFEEYYPSFSADDHLIAFNKIANGLNMYNDVQSELFVVPATGGTATRLAANDPPACTGKTSPTPGVTNSWPKWSPAAASAGGETYYWLIFSSTRSPAGNPQLYITSVVQAADGTLTTHGSIYLWNQPATENNHTPAWDTFKVPPQQPPK